MPILPAWHRSALTVATALAKSRELNSDFCGIGEKLYIKNPYKFADTHEKWEELFSETQIYIKVKAELKRTYDMENSLNYRGADKGEGQ